MTTKPTGSTSSLGKEGVHQSITGEPTDHIFQHPHNPHGPLTDEISLLSRKVCFKFDTVLVLPILTMLCEYQFECN